MILEIKKLLTKAEYTGKFEFGFQPEQDKLLIPLCRFEGGATVAGEYEIFDDDSVEVKFTLKYRIKGQCSYCLEDAEKEIEYNTDALFVTESDPDNYVYDGFRLDLTDAVNDALLFSQPKVLLCRDDCKGVKLTK